MHKLRGKSFRSIVLIIYLLLAFSVCSPLLVNQEAHLHEDLKIKFVEGAKERKELYNKVLELKGELYV